MTVIIVRAEIAFAETAPDRPSHDAKSARDATRLPDRLWPQSDSIVAL